jgi:signal transduction histidine kinase/ActR/RegA family two-component response regulator
VRGVLGRLSTRARVMSATLLAALPLVALVLYSAIDRYEADRARAETRAASRAQLAATVLSTESAAAPPSQARLRQFLAGSPDGSAVVVYAGMRPAVRAGPAAAGPPMSDPETRRALARRSGVFTATGGDGVQRVWGVHAIGRGALTVVQGYPGDATYGPARSALRRDIILATVAAVVALVAAFLLAGLVTAPIRRLAARVGGDGDGSDAEARDGASELGTIERSVMRNVDARRRLEEQLRQAQKMEAVGQLAGGIAHDFNNLLTVISGYSDIARRSIGAGPGADELGEIQRAATRAADLTRQLLAFARQQVLEPVVLDLNEVLRALTPMLARLIGEDIHIAVAAEDDLPSVVADRAQIEQAIINLAVNARDAMPDGGTLTIETRSAVLDEHYVAEHAGVEPGPYVCLTVTDTGTGMGREQLEHIFEPFYTTKEVGKGTGLGLASVHGITTQSNGHVQVYSELGLGTTFKIYLPAVESAVAPGAQARDQSPERLGGTETVLLCEDEGLVRGLVERVLAREGYRVRSSRAPREALDMLAREPSTVDILVTDVIMPEMSGPELAERVRATHPGLPTLFLSGYTSETVRERGKLPPDSAFLEKPFDGRSLLRNVRALLDGHSVPRQGAHTRDAS